MPITSRPHSRAVHLLACALAMLVASCDGPVEVGSDEPSFGVGCASARAGATPSEIGCGLRQSSGIAAVDAAVAQDLLNLRQFFAVYPTFSFFDECSPENMNALAFSQGHILLGRYLAAEFSSAGSTLPVIAILAHEFGHIHQFANGWFNQGPTVREHELEADAFAGFYGGLVKGWGGESLDAYYQALFAVGDFNFNHPSHHGTPVQRLAAGGLGLLAAILTLQQNLNPTPAQLHAFFDDRIRNCITAVQDPSVCLNSALAQSPAAYSDPDPVVSSMLAHLNSELILGLATGRRTLSEIPRAQASSELLDVERRWYR